MNITIKIKLSSGKEIKLTEEEYEELKEQFSSKEFIPIRDPVYPIINPYPNYPDVVYCDSL